MHLPLKKVVFCFFLVYAALFLESFLKLWLPVNMATPEMDVAILGMAAMQGPPEAAALLGFWNGLLRDSLTVGENHGWTVCFLCFASGLALWVREKRVGLIKKSSLFFGGLLATHALLSRKLLFQTVLPSICLTTLAFLVGIRFFQRWLSQSGSE